VPLGHFCHHIELINTNYVNYSHKFSKYQLSKFCGSTIPLFPYLFRPVARGGRGARALLQSLVPPTDHSAPVPSPSPKENV
jgi:hypothetical protein